MSPPWRQPAAVSNGANQTRSTNLRLQDKGRHLDLLKNRLQYRTDRGGHHPRRLQIFTTTSLRHLRVAFSREKRSILSLCNIIIRRTSTFFELHGKQGIIKPQDHHQDHHLPGNHLNSSLQQAHGSIHRVFNFIPLRDRSAQFRRIMPENSTASHLASEGIVPSSSEPCCGGSILHNFSQLQRQPSSSFFTTSFSRLQLQSSSSRDYSSFFCRPQRQSSSSSRQDSSFLRPA